MTAMDQILQVKAEVRAVDLALAKIHYKFAAANWESSVSVRTSVEKKAGPTLNICPTKWKDQDQQWQQQHQLLVTIMTNRSLLKVKKWLKRPKLRN